MALHLDVSVRMGCIEIDQVLCTRHIGILVEDVTLLQWKLERSIQFLRWRRAVRDLYVNRRCSDRFAFANLYMRCHFVLVESEIVGYVRVVVSMRLIKALDMSQVVFEHLRIEVGKRLPDLIPGTLFRRHHGDHCVAWTSAFS